MRPPVDTSRRPFVLIWELTQACDLTCEHCRADAQERRHPDELSTAEAKDLLDSARAFGENQLVVFSGGDPCKRPDLVELVQYGTDIGLTVTLTPSGTAQLTRDVLADLADAGLRRLALSIDGASADSHDAFRGESGSFAATMRAARAARDLEIPLQVNTTVCAETVDDLPGIRDRLLDLDAVFWSVFFLVPVGRGRVLDPLSPSRADEVMRWLADVSETEPFGVKTTEAPQYRRVNRQSSSDSTVTGSHGAAPEHASGDGPPAHITGKRSGNPKPPSGGGDTGIIAGDGFAFVSHTGDLYPSGFLPKSAGNVREDDLVDLYRDAPLFEQLRDRDTLEGKCGACPFRQVCGGSRSRAYAYTGNPLASDPLCPYVPPGYDGPLPDQQLPTPSD